MNVIFVVEDIKTNHKRTDIEVYKNDDVGTNLGNSLCLRIVARVVAIVDNSNSPSWQLDGRPNQMCEMTRENKLDGKMVKKI
mmetsp:Transcript_534/g.1162  ORF Transcript_534/g.1162 Transcript_534/m.1162 type:complete len:82 (+) Transcript_534:1902-2147(+)